jgi:competence protein ComEC
VRLLIPFAVGIIVHELLLIDLVWPIALALLAIFGYLIVRFTQIVSILHVPFIKGASLLLIMGCLGWAITHSFSEQFYLDYFTRQKGKYVVIRINKLPEQKAKSIKVEAAVIGTGDMHFKKSRGNLILYLQKKENSDLHYGDELLILKNAIKQIPSIKNPYEFDFQLYLHRNNFHHQGYLNNKQWTHLKSNSSNFIFNTSIKLQQYLQHTYSQYLPNIQHRGIIEAIVFGYRNDLDKEVVAAYSRTGIIHVLAVSGLHVGLIYSVLSLLTISLTTSLLKKRIRVAIIILFLVGYAILTGLSPSVCRAVLMFSFFVFKDAVKRDTNVYNVLAASAVILLCIQPLWLFNVGFQLSYLAVFSIVFLQPYIKNWMAISDWFLAQVWTLLAVSIAAQIITFPLCLYYFHQYPNLFFISNLIIIPLIFVVLSLAAFLPLIASFKVLAPLASLNAKLIDIYLDFINSVIFSIQNLPFAYFDNLYITASQMGLIYGLVFSVILWLIFKLPRYLWPAVFFSFMLIASQIFMTLQRQQKSAWVSFDIKGHANLGYKNGTDLVLFVDSALYTNRKLIDFHCKPWFMATCGGKMSIESIDSLAVSPINKLKINGDSLYILPRSRTKIWNKLPPKSTIFCLRPVYDNPSIKNLNIIAPTFKSTIQPKNWHSLNKNGFWISPSNGH